MTLSSSNVSSPRTSPSALGLAPSFGFGDRLGSATPGHLQAAQKYPQIRGIFAQQSIREMARTQRTPQQVMSAAAQTLAAAGYVEPWGADADHLKTPADVDYTADAGFTFFTIDPSDHVDQQADNYTPEQVSAQYRAVDWFTHYAGRSVTLDGGMPLAFSEAAVQRAAIKYGRAIEHAIALAAHIRVAAEQRGQPHEIEISVDETIQPTTLAEHYIIADQLLRAGINLVSLAPRFIGELEKGIDYIGSVAKLEESLEGHAAIARTLGPYKLSLHSGSDKLSMYTAFARATRGLFHVKTAGTSYLEALRVVASHDESLFRRIIDFSRAHYDRDKATYHVHATLDSAPETAGDSSPTPLAELVEQYLQEWAAVPAGEGFTRAGRQILHCTFGSVMTDATLGPAVHQCLHTHADTYAQVLDDHFTRHLAALAAGMPG